MFCKKKKRNKHTNIDLFSNLINGHSPHLFEHVPTSMEVLRKNSLTQWKNTQLVDCEQ